MLLWMMLMIIVMMLILYTRNGLIKFCIVLINWIVLTVSLCFFHILKTLLKVDSMRWFFHRRSPSPRVATQWYRLLLLAAYGLATAHVLLCIVNGDESAVLLFLSLVTLTFDLWPDLQSRARFLYIVPNRHVWSSCVYSFGSYRADKQTNTDNHTDKQTDATENIHLVSLSYAGG